MREPVIRPTVCVIVTAALAGCVSTQDHVGVWAYEDKAAFVRVALERDGSCNIVLGGRIGAARDGVGVDCRYSKVGQTITITEIRDIQTGSARERPTKELYLSYDPNADTIGISWDKSVRLLRTQGK
jgi:hypothetical protein